MPINIMEYGHYYWDVPKPREQVNISFFYLWEICKKKLICKPNFGRCIIFGETKSMLEVMFCLHENLNKYFHASYKLQTFSKYLQFVGITTCLANFQSWFRTFLENDVWTFDHFIIGIQLVTIILYKYLYKLWYIHLNLYLENIVFHFRK